MVEEKKGHALEGLEAPAAIAVRASLKKVFRTTMDAFESSHPDEFRHLAWIYMREEGKELRNIFIGGLVGAAWVAENTADAMKQLPGWFKEVVEIFFGDLPGTFLDYFDRRKATYTFPPGYTGPSQEDIPKIVGEVRKTLTGAFIGFFHSTPERIKGFFGRIWHRGMHRFLTTLFNADPTSIQSFFEFEGRTLKTEEQLDAFVSMIENFNDPEELLPFLALDGATQDMLFMAALRLKQHGLFPRMLRQAKHNLPQLRRNVNDMLMPIGLSLQSLDDSLVLSNEARRARIATTRYRPAQLREYPWRVDEEACPDDVATAWRARNRSPFKWYNPLTWFKF